MKDWRQKAKAMWKSGKDRAQKSGQDIIIPIRTKLATHIERNSPSKKNYQRYRQWRGNRHHGIGTNPRPKSKPDAIACILCRDTGSIIRGHDGRKVTCPNCRSSPIS